ncbi:unnamed protein product [Heligmosomoides polygyrus]|uniref:F-box/kelch-repeat protein n=1 Tax=Heligmosomoides polygyrus TaxID=6339 RepID=A0A183F6Y0_HELPZ|nr:unnamed protein product [Heligmosomoides polygyrus]
MIDASKMFREKIVEKDVSGKNQSVDRYEVLNCDDKNWQSLPKMRLAHFSRGQGQSSDHDQSGGGSKETEEVSWWWHSTNEMDFDTIGCAWVVIDNKKTLLCGDCEFGPIGLRSLDDKAFWFAVERVSYADKPPPPGFKPRPRKPKKTES